MLTHTIHLLPKCHVDKAVWVELIAHQKSLRLRALSLSPGSFSSTYEREIAYSDQDWEARLQNPLANTFIVAVPKQTLIERLYPTDKITNYDWVGTAVLYGPVPGQSDEVDVNTLEFHLFGVFVLPEFQGNGFGKAVVEAAIEHTMTLAKPRRANAFSLKVWIVSGNERALKMYKTLGFAVVEEDVGEQNLVTTCMVLRKAVPNE